MAAFAISQEPAAGTPADPGVGHVGCPREGGRLLRVRMIDRRRQRLRVRCDLCPDTIHEGRGPGRPLRPDETPPELVEVEPEHSPTMPATPSRQRVSDADILDALAADEDRRADHVAEALGYAQATSLMKRITRMNSAAGSPLVVVRKGHGSPTLLRRAIPSIPSTQTDSRPHDAGGAAGSDSGSGEGDPGRRKVAK
ncbi:MAG TPA: hypothetical protein VJU14_02555 [Solirubrobacterales bacterium]|nr:hypothetical protein [Solirubrobacterales bacterium]